jgi:Cu(I)/Ag(I) efflux system membrane fusion protein
MNGLYIKQRVARIFAGGLIRRTVAPSTFAILGAVTALILPGCGDQGSTESRQADRQLPRGFYTCPMHPSVASEQPGACPVCNMNLVWKETAAPGHATASHEDMLHLTAGQIERAGIQTVLASRKQISEYVTLTGTVVPDETRIVAVAARVSGRIERLFVRNPGESIRKGQPLFELYSETLLAGEREYLQALERIKKNEPQAAFLSGLAESAKARLLLWGLTGPQVERLEKDRMPSLTNTFYSTADGYLSELLVREGEYAEEGSLLMNVADPYAVWVEAQAYADEKKLLAGGNTALLSFDAFPGASYEGTVVYENPQLEPGSKISLVRLAVAHPEGRIIPGMMAYVHVRRAEKTALVIPKSALLPEKMETVWIETGEGMFERRMVGTGLENPFAVEITEGLREGDRVVTRGAYLLNSEYILKSGAASKHSH